MKGFSGARNGGSGRGKALALAALLTFSLSACAGKARVAARRVVEIRDCRIVVRDKDRITCRCDDPAVSEQVDARSGEVKRIAQCKTEKEKTK